MTQRTLRARLEALAEAERPPGLELATLTRYDIPALAALHLVAYDSPEIAENLWEATDELRMAFDGAFGAPRDDSFIGAWQDGELVGAVLCVTEADLEDAPPGPYIIDTMVAPDHRRRGIATALVLELARRCRAWGYEEVALNVDMRAAPGAARLYELVGFDDDGPADQGATDSGTPG
ncbi:MAG: GNAT family N-acetyltransferase [Actinomyces sp.]|jgi:GNAT superfamily N-acetyltransferase|nr:GNAT family N-acetyltransferase [Actinomyces sp.]MCI1642247.1 GNAT family N-acetyltransferase [Actinomyces sp.]MCI1662568.1 GNAT family N-acetyltransferase [Actinomyces sp.]MCI1690945.1 GNAT family N-acetyltransferase [Actinomyces sp.]MCI1788288.1 GNAT family N-acetyltransferase [Actinomyces sp.]MCI1867278.1 GNAT family N-acetyltransferase [Actinomyces sp.]